MAFAVSVAALSPVKKGQLIWTALLALGGTRQTSKIIKSTTYYR